MSEAKEKLTAYICECGKRSTFLKSATAKEGTVRLAKCECGRQILARFGSIYSLPPQANRAPC